MADHCTDVVDPPPNVIAPSAIAAPLYGAAVPIEMSAAATTSSADAATGSIVNTTAMDNIIATSLEANLVLI
ncbi:hypothetical protein [Cohnella rhizosphaerae]|uniref:Uncharacterized protein n=1 Tax=Cohnella rhizosphaerae TaxID=1457232 RepID=A0A9X4QWY5_9BACL|nr:hypothetical protein [Cohnella rhizosphaerae]MDG0814154.1 hypothetical protein [Cohnella rhizosphaerae]